MQRLVYGRVNQLVFNNYNEFYETYGFLCNDLKHNLKFYLEYNARSGAWANEGRIQFYYCGTNHYMPIPQSLANKLTAGVGKIAYRVNCNEYLFELHNNFGFDYVNGSNGITPSELTPPTYQQALSYVPVQFHPDFLRGYNM